MMNEDYLMISFENTHSAIQTERLLGQHFKVVTMPTLRAVTQSCGISLRLAAEDSEPVREMVAESGLSPELYAIYLVNILLIFLEGIYHADAYSERKAP